MQLLLIVRAWTELLYIDLIGLKGFRALQRVVGRTPVRQAPASSPPTDKVVDAVKTACALYVRPTLCLQRSVAVTRLLRRHGIPAQLVIGCRLPPLKAHAWVEVAGNIVSDRIDEQHQFYRVLDRW